MKSQALVGACVAGVCLAGWFAPTALADKGAPAGRGGSRQAPAGAQPRAGATGKLVGVAVGGTCAWAVNGNAQGSGSGFEAVLPAGYHTVACTPAGQPTRTQTAQVLADGVVTTSFKLDGGAATGKLVGVAVGGTCAWAVDGEAEGSGASFGVVVPVGSHEVSCTPPGKGPRTQLVHVKPEKPTLVNFKLGNEGGPVRQPGSGQPPAGTGKLVGVALGGACAFAVDGKPQGSGSGFQAVVPIGSHEVTCAPSGRPVLSQTTNVAADAAALVTFALDGGAGGGQPSGANAQGKILGVAVGGTCAFTLNGNPAGSGGSFEAVVPAGTHVVGCTPPGQATRTQSKLVTAGATTLASFVLDGGSAQGKLVGVAVGGTCAWTVDGASQGSGSGFEAMVSVGTHVVGCTPPGQAARSQSVAVKPEGPTVANFDLAGGGAPQPSRGPTGKLVGVAVGGTCAWTVDGASKGSGGGFEVLVPIGTHVIGCAPPGLAPRSQTKSVTADATTQATFDLSK